MNQPDEFPTVHSPYGEGVASVLARTAPLLQSSLPEALRQTIQELTMDPDFSEFWFKHSPADQAALVGRIEGHLNDLISAEAEEAAHRDRAYRVGYLHELGCFDLTLVSKLYKRLFRRLLETLSGAAIDSTTRNITDVSLAHRLMIDLSCQAKSHYDYQAKVSQLFISLDSVVDTATRLPDLMRGMCDVITGLDGIVAALIARPDSSGIMQIEETDPGAGRDYAAALLGGRAPMFSVSADLASGRGPAGRAWRERTIQVSDSTFADATLRVWRDVREELGFRSSAAVPLIDQAGEPIAVLALYSDVTGYFSNSSRSQMLRFIQQVAGHAVRRFQESTVIPVAARRYFNDLVASRHVEMVYQPIIDLQTRRFVHAEALARLKDAEGRMISPAAFLPALGSQGLLALFRIGLEAVCEQVKILCERPGMSRARLSLNMPADAFGNDLYTSTFFDVIDRLGVSGEQLIIEVLESRDPLEPGHIDQAIAAFRSAGVMVVQDDLGAGHSSLLRLDRVEFDGVKIDHGLVRRASVRPWRALEFMYHLTTLAQDVRVPVTIEGLENDGLIEAATIFGANFGQGYAIARPMPFADLLSWTSRPPAEPPSQAPRTALGVMAHVLLWERMQKSRHHQSVTGTTDALEDLDLGNLRSAIVTPKELGSLFHRLSNAAGHGVRSSEFRHSRDSVITYLKEAWLVDQEATSR